MMHDFLRPYGGAGGAGSGWVNRDTLLEHLEPDLADNIDISPGSSAWAWGSYVQIVASLAADFYPNQLHICFLAQVYTTSIERAHAEVELAVGAAGSEVAIATVPWSVLAFTSVPDADPLIITGASFPIGPTLVAEGSRLSARIRKSTASTAMIVAAYLYVSGYQSAPTSDTTYPLDDHLAGANSAQAKVTPAGSAQGLTAAGAGYPTYGSWTNVLDDAPADLLVWGCSILPPIPVGSRGAHLQYGTGPSGGGSEVARALLGLPSQGAFTGGTYLLRRPMLVLEGERWSARIAGQSLSVQHLYTEL